MSLLCLLPPPSDRGFDQLLYFLHTHVSSHLQELQRADTFYEVFATFIVGPPDHSDAGSALHSHLVGCATTDPVTHHLALFVPIGPDYPYKGPQEWAPHGPPRCLWPDLPFLVTSPDYVLGAQATISELRRCLGYSSSLNLFTTTHSLAGSDVLLHLPPPSPTLLKQLSSPLSSPFLSLMISDTTLLLRSSLSLKQLQPHSLQITNTHATRSKTKASTLTYSTPSIARPIMATAPHQPLTS